MAPMKQRDQIYDQVLVLRCREGDEEAFGQLMDRWQERLWRHAFRLSGHEDAAWDILQESWLGISRGIQRLQDPAAFPGWAYRIVSNKCRDWIRREQRRRQGVQDYADRYEQGFDTAEIAGILGIPEGTVRSRLHYTRKRLRALLEDTP